MHLGSRQHCYGDVEIVGEVGNCLQNVILDFDQPFMNCHLQVTAENSNELFEIEANILIGEVSNWPITVISLEVEYQSNVSRILATVLSIFTLFQVISVTIWSGVNSPGFNLRYSSQVLQSLGGSEDPGWTLTFLSEPCGYVMAPPLFDNQAEGKVMANKHSVGGVILDTCLWAQEDTFVAA